MNKQGVPAYLISRRFQLPFSLDSRQEIIKPAWNFHSTHLRLFLLRSKFNCVYVESTKYWANISHRHFYGNLVVKTAGSCFFSSLQSINILPNRYPFRCLSLPPFWPACTCTRCATTKQKSEKKQTKEKHFVQVSGKIRARINCDPLSVYRSNDFRALKKGIINALTLFRRVCVSVSRIVTLRIRKPFLSFCLFVCVVPFYFVLTAACESSLFVRIAAWSANREKCVRPGRGRENKAHVNGAGRHKIRNRVWRM